MHISLIITVLNEGESIHSLLGSIAGQTRPPDEVVVVDGGSTDGTLAALHEWAGVLPLHIVEAPGANISQGRNIAVEHARHDILAVTDAGVRLDPVWLEAITAPLASGETDVVAGFFLPDCDTPFEVAMGATVLPALRDIDPDTFMPSSRSLALRRSAFEAAGGYPEWLDYCEDLILDFRLHALRGPFAFAPGAVAYFRPRSTLRAFTQQYYRYARGDGKANLFFRRHAIRYMTYLVALPLLLLAALIVSPWFLLVLLAGGIYYVARPVQRLFTLWGDLTLIEKGEALFWVPVIRVAGDLAKMAGYPAGLVWRLQNRPPAWRV